MLIWRINSDYTIIGKLIQSNIIIEKIFTKMAKLTNEFSNINELFLTFDFSIELIENPHIQ